MLVMMTMVMMTTMAMVMVMVVMMVAVGYGGRYDDRKSQLICKLFHGDGVSLHTPSGNKAQNPHL